MRRFDKIAGFERDHSTSWEKALIVSYTDVAAAILMTAREKTYSLDNVDGLRKTVSINSEAVKKIM